MTADVPTTRAISDEAALDGAVAAALGATSKYRAECYAKAREVSNRVFGHPGAFIAEHWPIPEEEMRVALTAALPHLAQSSDEAMEAVQVAREAVALADRYGEAIIAIAGHLRDGTPGGVMRARTVIAGLDLDEATR